MVVVAKVDGFGRCSGFRQRANELGGADDGLRDPAAAERREERRAQVELRGVVAIGAAIEHGRAPTVTHGLGPREGHARMRAVPGGRDPLSGLGQRRRAPVHRVRCIRTDDEVVVVTDGAYGDPFMIAALLKQYAASVM